MRNREFKYIVLLQNRLLNSISIDSWDSVLSANKENDIYFAYDYAGNDSDYDASGNMPPYGAPGYGGRNMRDLGRRTNTGGRPFG